MNNKNHKTPVQDVVLSNIADDVRRIANVFEELLELAISEMQSEDLEEELEEIKEDYLE